MKRLIPGLGQGKYKISLWCQKLNILKNDADRSEGLENESELSVVKAVTI